MVAGVAASSPAVMELAEQAVLVGRPELGRQKQQVLTGMVARAELAAPWD